MRKMIAGLVMALGLLGFNANDAKAHGGNDGCCGGGWYEPQYQPCGHWELRSYCYQVWVGDCCCGHYETRYFQRYVWVQD